MEFSTMAIVRNRPASVVRRVTMWSLAADVVVALIIGTVISGLIGFIIFILGLILTGFFYLNARRVLKVRGY
jgi:hypothetical protein